MHSRLFLSLLILPALACGRDQRAGTDALGNAARAEASRGPDPVLIRLPRSGGTVRAYVYPRMDSVVWSGHTTSVSRVLGFDPEGGALATVNAKGEPARVDLRSGESAIASKLALGDLSSPTGTEIFGLDPRGTVIRLTRGGDWAFTPPYPARAVFPQADGSLIIASQHAAEVVLWHLRPPDTRIRDTATLTMSLRGVHSQAGDRVYLATDTALVAVRGRDLSQAPSVHMRGRVVALAPTPSGDRIYVAIASDSSLAVIDRYTDRVATTVQLPGDVADLRMDGLGRYVIARPVRGDSAWVIAVATNRVVGSVRTKWTEDLPAVAPDGAIALNSGRDVIFVDGETLQPVRTIAGGASDYWYFAFWNGFRPRAAGVDQPVSFATPDSTRRDSAVESRDSAAANALDTLARAPEKNAQPARVPPEEKRPAAPAPSAAASAAPSAAPRAAPIAPPSAARLAPPGAPPTGPFTVSFAALLNEAKAHALADSIQVDGVRARVAPSQRAGTTIYRVILGPYPNHAAAEQVGHDSKRSYWVFPGQP